MTQVIHRRRVGDLRTVLPVTLQQPGWTQNVIDVDAYGSPWKHWFAMLPNIRQPTTVFLTIGSTMFKGSTDSSVLAAMGCVFKRDVPPAFLGKLSEFGASYCLAKGCADDTIITEAVEAVSTGNARYLGVRIQPRKWSGQQVQTADRPEHTQSEKGIEHV
jgi:hypothetical protein